MDWMCVSLAATASGLQFLVTMATPRGFECRLSEAGKHFNKYEIVPCARVMLQALNVIVL